MQIRDFGLRTAQSGTLAARLRRRAGRSLPLLSRAVAFTALLALVSVLPWLSGNDPAMTILRATSAEREPTPEVLEAIRERLGLTGGPLHVIGHWLSGLAHGSLGTSWVSGQSIGQGLFDSAIVSLTLMAGTLVIAFLVAALLSARTLNRALRGETKVSGGVAAALLTATPEYLLAPLLLLLFSVYLGWLPPYGWDGAQYLVLPALALGLPAGGLLGGLCAQAISGVCHERWVTTWITAGIGQRQLRAAILRRAFAPLTGQVALIIVGLTGGGVAVERVFAIPGLGRALLGAASAQDVPVLQAGVLLILLLALLVGVLAQLARKVMLGGAVETLSLPAAAPAPVTSRLPKIIVAVGTSLLFLTVLWGIGRDPESVVSTRLAAPSWALPFGADALGRDLLARVAHGAATTIAQAFTVTLFCLLVALLLGLIPRAAVGFIEVTNAAPPVLAGMLVAAVTGPSSLGAAIAVALVGWAPLASHAAQLVEETRQRPDIALAPALGEGKLRITWTRVIPGILPQLVRHAALRLPGIALALAGLGFLGLGAQPPAAEWGMVLAEALPYIERAPWAVTAPSIGLLLLAITVVAASRLQRNDAH